MKHKRKRIAVIGLGLFGSSLARRLVQDCEVLVIDSSQAVINEIADDVHMALRADARDYASLAAVINEEFEEVVVCIGEQLEASILCVLHLKKLGVRAVHAKAINEDHGRILKAVGATNVVFPETESAQRLARLIVNPNLIDFVELSAEISVMEVIPPVSFRGRTLMALNLRSNFQVTVIAAKDKATGQTTVIPAMDLVVGEGTSLVVLGRSDAIAALQNQA
ncbi:TrkA family potassium uptake protein [Myxococcota bacterium]|nr:TrkA family potassium uptake protein [Myxococcota bacterium]